MLIRFRAYLGLGSESGSEIRTRSQSLAQMTLIPRVGAPPGSKCAGTGQESDHPVGPGAAGSSAA